jgi:hypothetical protein
MHDILILVHAVFVSESCRSGNVTPALKPLLNFRDDSAVECEIQHQGRFLPLCAEARYLHYNFCETRWTTA